MLLHRYRCDDTYLFRVPSIIEQVQMVASLRANNGAAPAPSTVSIGEEEISNVFVMEADKDEWDLEGVMAAAKAGKWSS